MLGANPDGVQSANRHVRAQVGTAAAGGLSAVMGYGIGVLGTSLWREFADRVPGAPSRRSWRII